MKNLNFLLKIKFLDMLIDETRLLNRLSQAKNKVLGMLVIQGRF